MTKKNSSHVHGDSWQNTFCGSCLLGLGLIVVDTNVLTSVAHHVVCCSLRGADCRVFCCGAFGT